MSLSKVCVVIPYPDSTPDQEVLSRGRNGYLKTTGVRIFSGLDQVELSPLTSRHAVSSSCILALPRNKATLEAIAAQLLSCASQL